MGRGLHTSRLQIYKTHRGAFSALARLSALSGQLEPPAVPVARSRRELMSLFVPTPAGRVCERSVCERSVCERSLCVGCINHVCFHRGKVGRRQVFTLLPSARQPGFTMLRASSSSLDIFIRDIRIREAPPHLLAKPYAPLRGFQDAPVHPHTHPNVNLSPTFSRHHDHSILQHEKLLWVGSELGRDGHMGCVLVCEINCWQVNEFLAP